MSTVDPNTWLSLNLSQRAQQDVFKRQLVQYLHDQFTSANITNLLNGNVAFLINGQNVLLASALTVSGQNLGSLAVNTAFNCNGALVNVVVFTFTASITVTLNNLPVGAMAVIQATCGPAVHTLKFAATIPGGTAYASIIASYAGTGANNMIATGISSNANLTTTFVGGSLTGPALPLVAA